MKVRLEASGLIMGVVNVTPDSFSDGGLYLEPQKALAHIEDLCAAGADIVDIGAESSRPGALPIDGDEEWRRLEPILSHLAQSNYSGIISLDTYKASTMRRALAYPVHIINDIRGGADPETLQVLASRGLIYLAMHMHRDPTSMQVQPLDGQQALTAVASFYKNTQLRLQKAGFKLEDIWLDPGIGFGKTDRANLLLLKQSIELAGKYPLLVGVSRKSFMGRLLDLESSKDRDAPSKMLELSLLFAGVKAIRTHDVRRLKRLKDLIAAPV